MVGQGEDAPPLLITKDSVCATGVFDGMGGSGAIICNSDYGEGFTKAYVASRIIKQTVQDFLNNNLGKKEVVVDDLKNAILERLRIEQEKFPPVSKSILRSKLVRDYPTTMALVTLQKEKNTWQVDSYWAGDSHCYLWTKDGFFQISRDDLEEDNDPMENLHCDSPISNCICADRDFYINHLKIEIPRDEPVIILAATDGCFGYYPTPMHFEDVIKRTLNGSANEEDWGRKLCEKIQRVTGDDASLSLIAVDFPSFDALKGWVKSTCKGIKQLKNIEEEIQGQQRRLKQKQEEYKTLQANIWNNYKKEYLRYIKNEDYATNA